MHWGATSQDIIDSGAVLQLCAALDRVEAQRHALCTALAVLAQRERDTGLPGRILLQQDAPVTFGLKAVSWLDALQRSRRRLRALRDDALVLQFGGAGTLAALQQCGLQVADALVQELRLPLPALPWHAARVPGLLATLFAALPQEHERAVGGWHAEWETLSEIVRLSVGSLAQMRVLIEGLHLAAHAWPRIWTAMAACSMPKRSR